MASILGLEGFHAGLLVSALCAIGSGLIFFAQGRRRLGPAAARQALLFLLLFPTSFFLLGMYSESLFLLLALLAFEAVGRGRPAVAAALAFLNGWTRPAALTLGLPLAIAQAVANRRENAPERMKRHLARAVLVGASPVAGVLLWIAILGAMTGEPAVYFHSQEAWRRSVFPLAGIVRFSGELPRRIARGDLLAHPGILLDYGSAFIFLAIAVLQIRWRRWADAAWTAGALLLPISTGVAASLPRYVLVVYPAFFALAELFERRPTARRLWWAGSALLLLVGAAAFVHWRWVA